MASGNITLTLSLSDEDRKLVQALTEAVTAMGTSPFVPAEETKTVETKPRSKPAAKKAEKPKKEEPAPEPETTEDDDDFDAPASTRTREDVLAMLKKVSGVSGKPTAVGILRKVGECEGLSELSSDKFDLVYEALEAELGD